MTTLPPYIKPMDAAPRYRQLFEIIRQKIESQEWAPHQRIPSERELEIAYGISRTTVRQAMSSLISQGYLYHKPGRGTFVSRPKLHLNLSSLTSFSDDVRTRGLEPGQRVISMTQVKPGEKVREGLALREGDQVWRIERLMLGNGESIGFHLCYLPLPQSETITEEELEKFGSLYKLLESRFNLTPAEAEETLEATAANEREARLLGIRVGSPLLLIERTTYSTLQRPMEWVKMLYRADRYKYHTRLRIPTPGAT